MNVKPNEAHSKLPDAGHMPSLVECVDCGTLIEGAPDEGLKCPLCGAVPSDRQRRFPPDRQRRLDERIRRYYADGDYEVVVILAATFLETLLEDVLARIMEAHGADVRLRAAVLDGQRSVGQRLGKLFPTLTGVQFEEAAAALGFRDFPLSWRRLRSERNAFIHDSAFERPREELNQATADEAMELLGRAYRLFAGINNRFAQRKGPDTK